MDTNHYEIIVTDSAKLDLQEIYEYISRNLKNEDAANKLMQKIEKGILNLEKYPYSCVEIRLKPHKKIVRKLVIEKYVILYRVDETYKQVVVLNVIYSKKDYLTQ